MFAVNMVCISFCSNKLQRVFTTWDQLNANMDCSDKFIFIHKRCCVATALAWSFTAGTTVSAMFGLIKSDKVDSLIAPFANSGRQSIIGRSLYLPLHINAPWGLVFCFMMVMAEVARQELMHINAQFRGCVTSDGAFAGDFEKIRRRHQSICRFVEDVDACVSFPNSCNLTTRVTEILLLLYNIIWWTETSKQPALLAINVCWLCVGATCIALSIFIFARVHTEVNVSLANVQLFYYPSFQAHALLNDLLNISLERTTERFNSQVNKVPCQFGLPNSDEC
jgi:hypothetical protein